MVFDMTENKSGAWLEIVQGDKTGKGEQLQLVTVRHLLKPQDELLQTGQVRMKDRTRITPYVFKCPDDPDMVRTHGPKGGGGAQKPKPDAEPKKWTRKPGKWLTCVAWLAHDDESSQVIEPR